MRAPHYYRVRRSTEFVCRCCAAAFTVKGHLPPSPSPSDTIMHPSLTDGGRERTQRRRKMGATQQMELASSMAHHSLSCPAWQGQLGQHARANASSPREGTYTSIDRNPPQVCRMRYHLSDQIMAFRLSMKSVSRHMI